MEKVIGCTKIKWSCVYVKIILVLAVSKKVNIVRSHLYETGMVFQDNTYNEPTSYRKSHDETNKN